MVEICLLGGIEKRENGRLQERGFSKEGLQKMGNFRKGRQRKKSGKTRLQKRLQERREEIRLRGGNYKRGKR